MPNLKPDYQFLSRQIEYIAGGNDQSCDIFTLYALRESGEVLFAIFTPKTIGGYHPQSMNGQYFGYSPSFPITLEVFTLDALEEWCKGGLNQIEQELKNIIE